MRQPPRFALARWVLVVMVAIAVATPVRSQPAPANDAALIQIDVTGTVERVPDMAVVRLGITGDAPDKDAALTIHYQNVLRILAVIRAAGVPAKDIEQRRPYVSPLHKTWVEDNEVHEGARIGFRASTHIELTLRDIAHAGSVIQAVIHSGATYIESISFELTDDHRAGAHAEARANAIVRAEHLATSSARAVGASHVGFISAAEPPPPDGAADLGRVPEPADRGPPLIIEPGTMEVTEQVRVTYRVVR